MRSADPGLSFFLRAFLFTLYSFCFAKKSYRIGFVHTQERLWRRDFCDRAKLRRTDLESGGSHNE